MTVEIADSLAAPVARSLAEVDWDFPQRLMHSPIEGIHPYPAKFVAELPRARLDALPVPSGTAVLDPCCGSGPPLVECQRRGLPSVGIDLNPIACLMTRVKTSSQPGEVKEAAAATVARARSVREVTVPQIPNLAHWFSGQVQNALAALSDALGTVHLVHRDVLRLALSSIVVRVSNQESDTRYAAVEKAVTAEDVFTGFLRAAGRIRDVLHERAYPLVPATVFQADTLAFDPTCLDKPIGMVITSPPYPNAYEYWLYHKYRMDWLGFDPIAVKEREMGARAHFFKRNHHIAADFVRQMAQTFGLLRQVRVRDGYVCFVIGRSRIHGRIVDNAAIIEEVAGAAGFERIFVTERRLSATLVSPSIFRMRTSRQRTCWCSDGEERRAPEVARLPLLSLRAGTRDARGGRPFSGPEIARGAGRGRAGWGER